MIHRWQHLVSNGAHHKNMFVSRYIWRCSFFPQFDVRIWTANKRGVCVCCAQEKEKSRVCHQAIDRTSRRTHQWKIIIKYSFACTSGTGLWLWLNACLECIHRVFYGRWCDAIIWSFWNFLLPFQIVRMLPHFVWCKRDEHKLEFMFFIFLVRVAVHCYQ